ncbi:hypothetical protein K8Q93_03195 [Candidatus Parcubacteria bacterium]|nr:hypothetical protein [Candidatus Parcubacteria bacterium]
MGLFSRSTFHSHPKLVLTVDAPSGSVEAALALAHGDKVHIPAMAASTLSTERRPLRMGLRSALEALSRDIHAHGLPLPKEAVVLVSSPSYRASTEIIRYEETSDFKVTPALVQKLLEAHFKRGGGESEGSHLIGTVVNGYRTLEPYGLFGRTLELFVLKSALERETARLIESEILRFFHLPVLVEPLSLALSVSLRTAMPALDKGTHLSVHMSGRATELLHFEEGMLLESASFPIGAQDLFTAISRSLHTTVEVMRDKIRLSHKGHAALSVDLLRLAGKEWVSLFEKASEMITERSPRPESVVLLAPPEILHPLEALIRGSFTYHRGGRRGLPVIPLTGVTLSRSVALPGDLGSATLAIAALFAHTQRSPFLLSTSSETLREASVVS